MKHRGHERSDVYHVGLESLASFRRHVSWLLLVPALFLADDGIRGARNDNNVEWDGVFSHPGDRQPLHPGRAEPFTVELRVFRGDITGARVRTWDGEEGLHDMAWNRNENSFDVWQASIPGTTSEYLYYRFEITDGQDRDYYNALGMWNDPPASGDFLINTTDLGQFQLGATPDGGGAVFRVWAPNATQAAVAGTFNDWSVSAHTMSNVRGFWQVRVPLAPHRAQYKFVFNGGQIWRTDPRARAQVNSVGNSVLWRSGYTWNDQDWVTPHFEDMVIYELHVGTFSGDGDGVSHHPATFRDVVDHHLDHLVDLGINVIELMPVGEFAAERSWGYNPSFLFAPESGYGSPDDLRYLVDRCHQGGIGVILDVVYNHMGASDLTGNLLEYDGQEIYFYPPGNDYRETPWGPRLDYGRHEVRDLIRDNIRYWLEEFHLDGFRIDGTDFVKINRDGWELLRDIARAVDTVSRKAIAVAEQLPNDPAVTRPIAEGGAGLDSQWNDLFHDSSRAAIGAAAFGDPDLEAVGRGMRHPDFEGTRAVNYIESHDEAAVHGRVAELADASDPHSEWAYGRSKLAFGLVMFTAGIPLILQGQEFMEDRRFGDDRGDRIQWHYRDRYHDFYLAARDMVWLRRTQPALRSDAFQNLYHLNDGDNVLAWHRWTGFGDDLVIVASFRNSDFPSYCLGFPLGAEWFEVFNSDAAVYGGRNRGNGGRIQADGPAQHGLPHSTCITLPRMGVLVFAREPLSSNRPGFLRGDCNSDGAVDISDAIRSLFDLFVEGVSSDCEAACDANGDSALDVSDAVFLLGFLFRGGGAPPLPWPECSEFPSALWCERDC